MPFGGRLSQSDSGCEAALFFSFLLRISDRVILTGEIFFAIKQFAVTARVLSVAVGVGLRNDFGELLHWSLRWAIPGLFCNSM
jgi:hypothetical protein